MKQILTILLGIAIITLVVGKTKANDIQEIGGVIRPDGSGQWYILDDAGHTPQGLDSISQTSTYIQVNYEEGFGEISWSIVTADETLVMSDIACGVSTGYESMKIFCARDRQIINPSDITHGSSNIYIYTRGVIDN